MCPDCSTGFPQGLILVVKGAIFFRERQFEVVLSASYHGRYHQFASKNWDSCVLSVTAKHRYETSRMRWTVSVATSLFAAPSNMRPQIVTSPCALQLREATARSEVDQRHPGHIERRVVGPNGTLYRCTREERKSRERSRAAAIPKHKRSHLEIVPTRFGFVPRASSESTLHLADHFSASAARMPESVLDDRLGIQFPVLP